MASGGGIVGNTEILDIDWPEDLGLCSPTTFDVRIMGTRQSASLKLYINGVLTDELNIDKESSSFDYENIDLLSVGKDITVEIQGFDNNGVAIEGSRLTMIYSISMPATLAESVYCIFRALQDILENGGYDTSKAAGLFSLINILEEI